MKIYTEDTRRRAVQLSRQIGARAAGDRLGIPYLNIYNWRLLMKKYGRTTEPTPPKLCEPTAKELIDEAVNRAVERNPGSLCCWYGVFYGIPGIVTAEARELVRERLRAFPDICLRAQAAEGTMKIVLDYEIRTIKNALTDISTDPFYQIVPDLYFHGFSRRETSYRQDCDVLSLKTHEKRLVDEMALRLYGVQAWWRPPSPATS